MTARAVWFVVIVQFAVASAASIARADPVEDSALAHLDRGAAAYRARDFARAIDELTQASRLVPDSPDPYRWLALTQAEIDDCQSALRNIEAFVSRVQPWDSRVPELLALRARCSHTGNLSIESTPDGATIRVDGGPSIGMTPAKHLAMRVGPHTIIVEKPGFEPESRRVEVRAFDTDNASFVLREHSTPLLQRWWFWAALSAVAVGAVVLTYDTSRSPDPSLPTVTCSASGCRP
jgi:hypothetical protein